MTDFHEATPAVIAHIAPLARKALTAYEKTLIDLTVRALQVTDVGKFVVKDSGDYLFAGEIRSVFTKKSGAVRYVVEDVRGVCMIMNARQIGFAEEALDQLPVVT